jgi:hypothetical protein
VPKPSIKLLYIPNIGFTIGKLHLVLKIDTYNGEWIWVEPIGGSGNDEVRGVVGFGTNVIVGGKFQDGFSVLGTSTTLESIGRTDIFVASLRGDNGGLNWAKGFGGSGEEEGTEVDVDANGKIGIAGSFQNELIFGNLSAIGTQGRTDFLIGQLNATNGEPEWISVPSGGSETDFSYAIASIPNGSGFAYTGFFTDKATFGNVELTSNGLDDAVVGQALNPLR